MTTEHDWKFASDGSAAWAFCDECGTQTFRYDLALLRDARRPLAELSAGDDAEPYALERLQSFARAFN